MSPDVIISGIAALAEIITKSSAETYSLFFLGRVIFLRLNEECFVGITKLNALKNWLNAYW